METAMLPKPTNIHRRRLAKVGRVVPAETVRRTQTVQDATTPSRHLAIVATSDL